MLKNKNKVSKATKNKLIASSISLFFSIVLVVAVTVAYGWFSSNQEVQARGMSIKVDSIQSNITTTSCYAFKYDGISGAVAINVDENSGVEMSEYDKIFPDRVINTPLIIRVVATGVSVEENSKISVEVPCLGAYTNNATNPNNYVTNDTIINNLSNVIYVKVGCGLLVNGNVVRDSYTVDENTSSATINSIYTGARDLFLQKDNGVDVYPEYTFINQSSSTKISRIEIELSQEVYSPFVVDDELVFYIEINYNAALMSQFLETNAGSQNDDGHQEFVGDLSTMYLF